jgi:hypothetical protein
MSISQIFQERIDSASLNKMKRVKRVSNLDFKMLKAHRIALPGLMKKERKQRNTSLLSASYLGANADQ